MNNVVWNFGSYRHKDDSDKSSKIKAENHVSAGILHLKLS